MKKVLFLVISLIFIFNASACEKPAESPTPTPPPKTGATPEPNEVISQDISFYFPDEAVMYLVPEVINVNVRESEFLESIIQTVIKGPVSEELNPAISGDVKVLSATVRDGICTIDLSSEFAKHNTGGTTKETMAIYSIVNTLCSLDSIDKVKINIDGNENPDFGGHYSLDEPLEANMSLVKKNK